MCIPGDVGGLARIHDLLRSFRSGAGVGVAGDLPFVLLWGMGFLMRHLQGEAPKDAAVVEMCFGAADRLAKRHRELEMVAAKRMDRDKFLVFARRILRAVEQAEERVTLRTITRSFEDQKKDRFVPVLAELVEAGVLVEREDSKYEVGGTRFEEFAAEYTAARDSAD